MQIRTQMRAQTLVVMYTYTCIHVDIQLIKVLVGGWRGVDGVVGGGWMDGKGEWMGEGVWMGVGGKVEVRSVPFNLTHYLNLINQIVNYQRERSS